LDIDGDPDKLGKATNKDIKAGKATFVSLLGVERARAQAEILINQAIKNIESFGEKGDLLRDLARFVIERHN
jgi:farnesyl diphosphate synthase